MKWDKSTEGVITQIKKRNYPAAIKDFGLFTIIKNRNNI